jgi:transcriptional regulator with XRE-family HTH domain
MNSVSRVKAICKERKIPISRLEKDLGYANGYIGQLRKGTFPDDRLVEIANYLGVSAAYLSGVEEQKENPTASGEVDFSDMELLAKFKAADETTQELIRRALGLK